MVPLVEELRHGRKIKVPTSMYICYVCTASIELYEPPRLGIGPFEPGSGVVTLITCNY